MEILSDKKLTAKLTEAANVLKAINHPIRKKIIGAIAADPPMSVNEICAIVGLTQPKCSMHLAILRKAKVVTCKTAVQDARSSMYDVVEERIDHIVELGKQILKYA